MKLDCNITEEIRGDFSSLWKCKKSGKTLEITTPYLLPDSTLFTAFLTKRGERYIVCDGGIVNELLSEYCPFPLDELRFSLENIAGKFQMKKGDLSGQPLFFKDCTDKKIVSSLIFDVASFAIAATNALIADLDEDPSDSPQNRFQTRAESFIRSVVPPKWEFGSQREIKEVPGFQFGAVLTLASKVCLISYVTGSNPTYFRRNVNDTAKSFAHAWHSSLGTGNFIYSTIPVINTDALGYKPDKLKWQLEELKADSHHALVNWNDRQKLKEMMTVDQTSVQS